MGSEAVHDTLGLGAIGGGFFLGVWPVVIGDLQPREAFQNSYMLYPPTNTITYVRV